MKRKDKNAVELFEELLQRYPKLSECQADIQKTFGALIDSYRSGGKLLVAGNGGSAADSEHIIGELQKSFLFYRKIDLNLYQNLISLYGEDGESLASTLEGAYPAVSLTSMPAISTAFANDVNATACFAQMLSALGKPEDVFLGISTSGNSENIRLALMVAKARGMTSVLLTGETGGVCRDLADISICVPEKETFKIQELHLPVYHALCAMLEAELFEER